MLSLFKHSVQTPAKVNLCRKWINIAMEVSVGNYATFNTDQCEQFAHSHHAAAPDWGGSVAEWLACWTQTQKGLGEAQWV